MISHSFEGSDPGVIHDGGRFIEPRFIWKFLTNTRARGAINVWYNLSFDGDVLMSEVLGKSDFAELLNTNSVLLCRCPQDHQCICKECDTCRWIQISYVPTKFLHITDWSDHSYWHYDVSQFFFSGTLNDAAENWLGVGKLPDVDAKKFGQSPSGDRVNDYIEENWNRIIEYAKRDADLTHQLYREAVTIGESKELGVPMGRPISTGYLAQSYLMKVLNEKPGLGPSRMASLAWEAYAGGRFEAFSRGMTGPVIGPDINSAYPYELHRLPDPSALAWESPDDPTIAQLRNADYGFIDAVITTDETRRIQPFAVKPESLDKLVYPALSGYRTQTLLDTFLFAIDHDYIEDYEIRNVWLGYETGAVRYPFDFIVDLYDQRIEYKQAGREKLEILIKIILNSMYGKLCQTTPKRRLQGVDETVRPEPHERYIPHEFLPPELRKTHEEGAIEALECGHFFNPFLASYITGRTRLHLHEKALEYGWEDDVIMFATDCLMVERDSFEASPFRDREVNPTRLGKWDMDYEGSDSFVVGVGVYEIDLLPEGVKTKTRGFKESDLDGQLRQEIRKAIANGDNHIDIESTRPQTAAEIAAYGGELANVGKFISPSRELRADMDDKRRWHGPDTYEALMGERQDSDPLIVDENGDVIQ